MIVVKSSISSDCCIRSKLSRLVQEEIGKFSGKQKNLKIYRKETFVGQKDLTNVRFRKQETSLKKVRCVLSCACFSAVTPYI